jgi:hypothetical protein
MKPDKPVQGCLHCTISLAILDHLRCEQGLRPDQYPEIRGPEVRAILANIAQVVVDTVTPCENGEDQLHRRIAVFTGMVTRFGLADLRRATPQRPHGVSLQ